MVGRAISLLITATEGDGVGIGILGMVAPGVVVGGIIVVEIVVIGY